jgi:6-phosphogluconolactonase
LAITEPELGGDIVSYCTNALGELELIGGLPTGADAPCHLAVDWRQRRCFVAHYHGGSVAVLSLSDSSAPLERLAIGTPPTAARGEDRSHTRSRPHASLLLAGNELLVTDAGRDFVLLYKIRPESSELELLDAVPLPRGAGPRHMAHGRGADVIYVSNQNSGGVSIIARTAASEGPRLELRGAVPATGLGRARPVPSEIAMHPNLDIVYMANRMDDSLSIFSIESDRGELAPRGCVDVRGRNPRHFAVSPDGKWLIVANQDSDELTSFRIIEGGCGLEWTGRRNPMATPTAICF